MRVFEEGHSFGLFACRQLLMRHRLHTATGGRGRGLAFCGDTGRIDRSRGKRQGRRPAAHSPALPARGHKRQAGRQDDALECFGNGGGSRNTHELPSAHMSALWRDLPQYA